MRHFNVTSLALALSLAVPACAINSGTSNTFPVENLSDVDSLTVLMHFEKSGVPISQDRLENDVVVALEQIGIGVSLTGSPYLHVRVYCRCGEPNMPDQETTRGNSASWHFGMWVDQSSDYERVWGPLPDICPSGPVMWSTGGRGAVADGDLPGFIQRSLSEFAEDYRAANPQR